MPHDENTQRDLNNHMAMFMIVRADITALLGLCSQIAARVGMREIDSLSIGEWHAMQRIRELERSIIELEDVDPGLAAIVLKHVDSARDAASREASSGLARVSPADRFPRDTLNHTDLTLMILWLNCLIDSGRYDDISIEEVRSHIGDGSILRFLKQRAGTDVDFSLLDSRIESDAAHSYVGRLQSILSAYGGDERKRWGIENRGLGLLLAWTNEILQRGTGWRPGPDSSDEDDR